MRTIYYHNKDEDEIHKFNEISCFHELPFVSRSRAIIIIMFIVLIQMKIENDRSKSHAKNICLRAAYVWTRQMINPIMYQRWIVWVTSKNVREHREDGTLSLAFLQLIGFRHLPVPSFGPENWSQEVFAAKTFALFFKFIYFTKNSGISKMLYSVFLRKKNSRQCLNPKKCNETQKCQQ